MIVKQIRYALKFHLGFEKVHSQGSVIAREHAQLLDVMG